MLEVGDHAPAFRLPGTDGGDTRQYELTEFTEAGAVVLLFYPFDFSPVCSEELCRFQDSEWFTLTPDLDVLGVSTDSAFAHRVLIRRNGLSFPLLSDHDGSVSDRYGVLAEEVGGHPCVSERAVFVVDDSETVRYAWSADEWVDDPDVGEVYDAVTDLECLNPAV